MRYVFDIYLEDDRHPCTPGASASAGAPSRGRYVVTAQGAGWTPREITAQEGARPLLHPAVTVEVFVFIFFSSLLFMVFTDISKPTRSSRRCRDGQLDFIMVGPHHAFFFFLLCIPFRLRSRHPRLHRRACLRRCVLRAYLCCAMSAIFFISFPFLRRMNAKRREAGHTSSKECCPIIRISSIHLKVVHGPVAFACTSPVRHRCQR